MEFLKNLALPQPTEHFHLLLLILGLVFVVFVPYSTYLFGSSVVSVIARARGRRQGDRLAGRLARELAEASLGHGTVPLYLAVIPALSLVFLYSQLLQGTAAIAAGLALFGFVALAAGVLLLLRYRSAFRIGGVLDQMRAAQDVPLSENDDVSLLARDVGRRQDRDGRAGVWSFGIGLLLFSAASAIAANPSHWADVDTVFDLLLAPDAWLKVLQVASIACAATGVGMLFVFFGWEREPRIIEREYAALIRRIAFRLVAVALLAQPALLVGYLSLLPGVSLSGGLFALAGSAVLVLFATGHCVYAFGRDPRPGLAAYAFYSLGLAVILLVLCDQTAISTATRGNAVRLAEVAERSKTDLKARLGVGAPSMSGEDIYNGKCSACHLFDAKKVGPPYRETLPKYSGRKDQLVAFILNPSKVNPAYPSMPAQGLKPAEADSIASYLLRRVLGDSPAPGQVSAQPQQK